MRIRTLLFIAIILFDFSFAFSQKLKVNVKTDKTTSIFEKYSLAEVAMSNSGRFVVYADMNLEGRMTINFLDLITLDSKEIYQGKYAVAGAELAFKFSENEQYLAIVESSDVVKSSLISLYDIKKNKITWSEEIQPYFHFDVENNSVIAFGKDNLNFAVIFGGQMPTQNSLLATFETELGTNEIFDLNELLVTDLPTKGFIVDNNLEQSIICKSNTWNTQLYSKYISIQYLGSNFILTRKSDCYKPKGWFKTIKKEPFKALELGEGIRWSDQILDQDFSYTNEKYTDENELKYLGHEMSTYYGSTKDDTIHYYADEYKLRVIRHLGKGIVDLWAETIDKPFSENSIHLNGNYSDVEITKSGTRVLLRKYNGNEMVLFDLVANEVVVKIYDTTDNLLIITPDSYYKTDKNVSKVISFSKGLKSYGFGQFDIRNNRPDIVIDRIGLAVKKLVSLYKKAYLKRLKSLDLTEDIFDSKLSVPKVTVEEIGETNVTSQNKIDLKISAKDLNANLKSLHVIANGVPIHGARGIPLSGLQEIQKTISVDLEYGVNNIEVYARNVNGYNSIREKISAISTTPVKKSLYLFTIGVSEFNESDYNLTYAKKDANDIATLFKNNQTIFDNTYIKTYSNQEVTSSLGSSIKDQIKNSQVDDYVVIFVASHGLLDEDLNYYLAGYNTEFESPENGGLLYENLEGAFEGGPARNRLMLIDACHSGEVDRDNLTLTATTSGTETGKVNARGFKTRPSSITGLDNSFELMKKLFQDVRDGSGSFVISASGGLEFAFESEEWNNGVFTYALLNGITTNKADYNEDKEINVKELYKYVKETVDELTNGKQVPTTRTENSSRNFKIWSE